jgi:hypothetical protein
MIPLSSVERERRKGIRPEKPVIKGRRDFPAEIVSAAPRHGRANRYEFETSSVNIFTLTPILPCYPLKFLYATLRIAKILEVEENRPLKMKQMPPKKNPK